MRAKRSTHVPKQTKIGKRVTQIQSNSKRAIFFYATEYTSAKNQSTDPPDFWKHSKESNYGR